MDKACDLICLENKRIWKKKIRLYGRHDVTWIQWLYNFFEGGGELQYGLCENGEWKKNTTHIVFIQKFILISFSVQHNHQGDYPRHTQMSQAPLIK